MDSGIALKLMKKYGFNSVNDSPYLCFFADKVGLSIKYVDKRFGVLERVTLFDNVGELEQFLKMYRKYVNYGKGESINIRLDDYQSMFPNILFVKDEKMLLSDEMVNGVITKDSLSDLEKLKVVAKNLLFHYLDLSSRQVKHINNVNVLKSIIACKEKMLQEEIMKLRKKKAENNIPIIEEKKFMYDNSLYKSYEEYLKKTTTLNQVIDLITSLWNLNKKLELSKDYYKSILTSKELVDKIRLLDAKIDYVRSLKGKSFLLVNLKSHLKQIEKNFTKVKIDSSYVEEEVQRVKRKYSMFDKIAIFNLDDYLKEAFLYDNYEYLAGKYSLMRHKSLSKNDIISNLRKSYQLLSFDERRVLTLFNSKYRHIFDLILEISNFSEWPIKKLTKYLEDIESVSRFKEECIDELCVRLAQDVNRNIREKYFVDVNFKSFKLFIKDMVRLLVILKNINDKMVLSDDMELFMDFVSMASLKKKYVYYLSSNNSSILGNVEAKKHMIGVFKILKGSPVLYSPYNIDFGDLYDKSSKLIKEVNNNKVGLVIDVNDVIIMRDKKISEVYCYKSIFEKNDGVAIVKDIRYQNKINYCNFTISKR